MSEHSATGLENSMTNCTIGTDLNQNLDTKKAQIQLNCPVSLTDLSDNLFGKIIGHLDFAPRLKLRISKKMEQRLLEHPIQLESIALTITPSSYALKTTTPRLLATRHTPYGPNYFWSLWRLVQGLRRWSVNTYVHKIEIDVQAQPNDNIGEAINALFQFQAESLIVHTKQPARTTHFQPPNKRVLLAIPQVNFSNLHLMAHNMEHIYIQHMCTAIEAMDLCTIRRSMISGECSLKSLSIIVTDDVYKPFLKACFEVAVEDGICTKTLKGVGSHVTLYSKHATSLNELLHFNNNHYTPRGDVMTTVERNRIRFERISHHRKTVVMRTLYDVEVHPMRATNSFYHRAAASSVKKRVV